MKKPILQEAISAHNKRFAAPLTESELHAAWPEFAKSLRRVCRAYFENADMTPSLLGHERGSDYDMLAGGISSFREFWLTLPETYDHRLTFEVGELLPLFCCLAEPPRFGTAPGRYPEQIDIIRKFLKDNKIEHPDLLDVGCGTGLGTLELASSLQTNFTLGITPEPLEIKMANDRFLPHDQKRSSLYAHFSDVKAAFQIGAVDNFTTSRKFHIITCNGLIGGPLVSDIDSFTTFIENCRQHLYDSGCIFCANNFHEGHKEKVELFMKLANASGNWHCAWFQPENK